MTNEQIDVLWQKALRESVEAGEQFTRYRFAALVREDAITRFNHQMNQLCEEARLLDDGAKQQEPVGVVESSEEWGVAGVLIAGLPIGTKLYAAPVRTKAAGASK